MSSDSRILHTRDGKTTHPEEIEAIVDALKAIPTDRPLLLWFHGGLVTTETGENTASELTPFLESHGAFPVFLVWESGIGPSLRDGVAALVKRKLMDGLLRLVGGLIHVKTGEQALGIDRAVSHYELTEEDEAILREAVGNSVEEPQDMRGASAFGAAPTQEFQNEFYAEAEALSLKQPFTAALRADAKTEPVTAADREVDERIRKKLSEMEGSQPAALAPISPIGWIPALTNFTVAIAKAVLDRFQRGRDHGIVQTIIEETVRELEIGKDIWDAMKSDAQANFAKGGGGRQLLIRLGQESLLQGRPVLLVGHSTGAVVIHHVLEAARDENLGVMFHLRYLAPASRCDLTAKTFAGHKDRIASARVFGMGDPIEHTENLLEGVPGVGGSALLKGVYKGSLLYFVSGALEAEPDAPLFGMQRFIAPARSFLSPSEAADVRTIVEAILALDKNAFVWTKTNIPGTDGYQGQSVTHGGFDDLTETGPNGAITSLLLTS